MKCMRLKNNHQIMRSTTV